LQERERIVLVRHWFSESGTFAPVYEAPRMVEAL